MSGTITAIKPAVKTPGRWNVFIEGKYSFSLADQQVLEHRLKIGQQLSDDDIAVLKNDSEFGKAYARALDFILRRPRSEKELRDYSRRKEWPADIRDRVIEKLYEKNYLNDKKFAESWVRSRTLVKPSSRRKLELELRQKGVSSAIIKEVFADESSEHDELEALRRVVAKKRSRYSDERKLMAYLARQGFGFEAIKAVLSE